MKVLLIDPPTSRKNLYGNWDLSGVDTYCPPLGLLYIASYLRKHHHDPQILDLSVLKWSIHKIINHVLSSDFDVIGISAKTINVFNANRIAEELKRRGCKTPVVLGGAHITAVPEETLNRFHSIDFGVIGEGECTFLELIDSISKNQSIENVKGVAWRNSRGEIILNPPRPLIQDLDSLPFPAWDLLPNFPHGYRHSALDTKRLPAASIITSRGCPHQCTFCDRAVFGSRVRYHSAKYTLDMIRRLINDYGIKDLMILDDNFLINRDILFKICDGIIREKLDLSWYCLSHAKFMTEDRLRKAKDAGCWIMEVGIESGCERILKLIKKNTTKEEIASAVARAKKAGIKVKGNFIFGFPTETRENLEETIQFALDINISLFQLSFLTIWPGCELSIYAHKYGKMETDWNRLSHFQISYVPNGLREKDLLKASKKAFLRFYLRPRVIFENIASLTSFRALQCLLASFVAFLKTIFIPSSN